MLKNREIVLKKKKHALITERTRLKVKGSWDQAAMDRGILIGDFRTCPTSVGIKGTITNAWRGPSTFFSLVR